MRNHEQCSSKNDAIIRNKRGCKGKREMLGPRYNQSIKMLLANDLAHRSRPAIKSLGYVQSSHQWDFGRSWSPIDGAMVT